MLPPDVEPVAQQRSDRRFGATLLLFGSFCSFGVGYGLRCLVGWLIS